MDFSNNCDANDAISDSDLDLSEFPSVQSLDVSAYDLRWWVTEALQVLSTTQNAVEKRLIPWLLSHKSNSSNLRMHNEGSKWKCPPSFDTLDGGGTAKLLDQEICGPLREIPFEDWVRTALYDPCDAMKDVIRTHDWSCNQAEHKASCAYALCHMYEEKCSTPCCLFLRIRF